jgi:hypothetical protein
VLQRDAGVGEGKIAIGLGHEIFPRHLAHQIEHLLIQDLPGPDLLLYHVESSLLDVHEKISRVNATSPALDGQMH